MPTIGGEAGNPDQRERGLLRVLGMAFALAVGIGNTIGGGILRTPGEIAALLPDVTLFMAVWVFGGLNALLGATVYSELGAMIPRAGGMYVFAHRALGDYAGFFVGYTQWIQTCSAAAALAVLIGEYSSALVPEAAGHASVIAFAVLATVFALQLVGVRWGARMQMATTLAKTLALGGLVAAAFVMPHAPAGPDPAAVVMPHGVALMVALVLALQGVIFTYNGYYAVIAFGEELRDPGREIPRSMFRGLFLIITVYLLLNAAFLWVLPITRMAHLPFVGGAVAQALFGPRGDLIIRGIVMVSVLGTINSILLSQPRSLLAMARDRLFPRQAMRVNAGGTPVAGLLLSTLVAALFLLSGTFRALLAITATLMVVNYLLMYVSLIVLRRREPDAPRPYRAWGYPWSTGIGLLIAVVFLVGVTRSDPHYALIALLALLASYPLYRGVRMLRRREAP
jgi:APA family basic amino acid/polyamine antiporter